MEPDQYLTVASFGNDTDKDITLYLEMMCEEVVLSGKQLFPWMAVSRSYGRHPQSVDALLEIIGRDRVRPTPKHFALLADVR